MADPSSGTKPPTTTRGTAVAAALYAIVGGALTLAGWALEIPRLTDWGDLGIAMKANAALCAMGAGAALVLLVLLPRRRVLVGVAAIPVVLLGALTLGEHLTGLDLGIDTALFFEEPGAGATVAPGRMGPPASLSFTFLGTALLLATGGPRRRGLAVALGGIVLLIAALSMIGYLYGTSVLYGLASITGISLQMATILSALGIGILAAIPDRGLVAALGRADPGGAMLRRLLLPFVAISVAIGWLRIAGQDAGLYDSGFGTAARTLLEILLVVGLLWWTANGISRHVRAVRKSEERFRSLVSVITDVPWVSDAAGQFRSPQAAWGAYTGQTWEAQRDTGWFDVVHPDDRGPMLELWRQAREVRTAWRAAGRLWHEGSREWRHFTVNAVPLLDPEGSIREWVGACTDVEEQEQTAAALRRSEESERTARMEAEGANRIKDEFLATLSHELRAPLNAILGWLYLLKKGGVTPETMANGLEVMERNANVQAQLIADLLDMSRIISGTLRLEMQPVDLPPLVRAAVDALLPAAEQGGIHLEVTAPTEALPVDGDSRRLQQIVTNLISNAVKFTPRGGRVEVSLGVVNAKVEMRVADTGKGISKEFLPHAFDPFRQADASSARPHGGLGLGLAIVKQLVEQHGGTVSVESEGQNRGSVFLVRLPLARALRIPATLPETVAEEGPGLTGLRILVLDDEPDARELMQRLLERSGAEVTAAGSVPEALALLRSAVPHLLLSDIAMPGEDGYAFIREVRARGYDTPAIAVTAFARTEDRNRALSAGYQTHLSKPVNPRELLGAVLALARTDERQDPHSVRG